MIAALASGLIVIGIVVLAIAILAAAMAGEALADIAAGNIRLGHFVLACTLTTLMAGAACIVFASSISLWSLE